MRKSNFELLRIISMFLIVMSHCDDIFGLADIYSTGLGVNKLITDWLNAGGQIGVGCFLLISGYFMVDQTISLKKILKLAGEVWFYTIGIWAIWGVYRIITNDFGMDILKEAAYAFFPIVMTHYWFVTAYIILMVLSPFFNKLIFAMNKEDYKKFLFCIIIIFVVLQGGLPKVLSGFSEGRILPVFLYYFLGGYLKKYGSEIKYDVKRHLLVAVIFYMLLIASFYIITFIGVKTNSEAIIGSRYFYRALNSPIIVVICTELFVAISEMNIKNNVVINEIASCTFGVYLIHANRIIKAHLPGFFPIYKEQNSFKLFLYSVISVVCIYVICTMVDFLRKKLVEHWWVNLLDSHLKTHF